MAIDLSAIDLIHTLNVPMLVLDSKGIIEDMNSAAEKLTGQRLKEIKGKHLIELSSATTLEETKAKFKSALENGGAYFEQITLVDNKEKPLFVQLSLTVLINAKDMTGNIIAVIEDNSRHVEQTELLLECKEKYRSLFENAPINYQSLDKDGKFIEVNKQCLDTLGYSRDEILGTYFGSLLGADERKLFRTKFKHFIEVGEVSDIEFTLFKKDGTSILVTFDGSVTIDERKQVLQTHCITRDITAKRIQKEVEQQALAHVKENEEKYRTLLQSLQDTIVLFNKNDRISFYFAGEEKAQFINQHISEIFPFDDVKKAMDMVHALRKTGDPFTLDYSIAEADQTQWYTVAFSRHHDDESIVALIQNETRFKSTIQSLENSEMLLKHAQKVARMGFLTWNLKTNDMEWSAEVYRIQGVDPDTKVTLDLTMSMIHPDDLKYVQEQLDLAVKGIKFFNIDHRIVQKNGNVVWVHSQGRLLYDSSGVPSVLLGTHIDITERKNLETQLQLTQHSLSVNADIVMWLGPDAKIKYANDAACKITEYSQEELSSMTILDIDPNLTKEGWTAIWNSFQKEGSTLFESILKSKSGKEYPLEINISYARYANKEYAFSYGRDISARKATETVLQESEERFRSFFQNAPLYCYIVSPKGDIIDVNASALEAWGYTKDELIGKPALELYSDEDVSVIREAFANWQESGFLDNLEVGIMTKSGSKLDVILSANAIRDSDGSIIHSVAIQQDITDINKIRIALHQSEERFRGLFEKSLIAIELYDYDGNLIDVNQATLDLFGISDISEIKGFTLFENPNITDEVKEKLRRSETIRYTTEFDFEKVKELNRYKTSKSGTIFIDLTIAPMAIGEGKNNEFYMVFVMDVTEAYSTQQALRISEQQHRMILTSMNDMIFVIDNDNIYSAFYPSHDMSLYVDPETLVGKPIDEVLPAEITKQFIESFRRIRETGKRETIEYPLEEDNEIIWYEATQDLHEDGSSIVIVVKNITKIKKSLDDLLENEERFRNIFERIPAGMFLYELDKKGRLIFRYHNPAASEILGVDCSKFVGLTLEEAFPPLAETDVPERFRKAASKGISSRNDVIQYKDGVITGVYDSYAFQTSPNRMVTFFTDISKRKSDEETLRKSEERYRTLVQSIQDIIFVHDKNDVYTEVFASDDSLLTRPAAEFIGKHVTDFVEPDLVRTYLHLSSLVRSTGKPEQFDYYMDIKGKKIGFTTILTLHEDGESIVSVVRDNSKRFAAEEALQASERQMNSLFKGIPVSTYTWKRIDDDFVFEGYNDRAEEAAEGKIAELEGMNASEFHKEEPEMLEMMHTTFNEKRNLNTQAWYTCRTTGKSVYLNTTFVYVPPDLVMVHADDITYRINAEEALKESEERYRLLLEATFEGIFIHDNFKILEINQRMAEMYGREPSELIGASAIDYWTPESQKLIREHIRKGEVHPYELTIKRDDGSLMVVETIGRPCIYEGKNARIVAVKDITDRVKSEETIIASEHRYRSLYERMEDGFTVSDDEGKYRTFNQAYLRMLGYSATDLRDKSFMDITPKKWQETDKIIFQTQVQIVGYSQLYEKELIKKDGTLLPIEVRVHRTYDEEGVPTGTWTLLRDISQRKKSESELQRSAEAALLYLDIMGHDVRNHLQAIVMATEIMDSFEMGPEFASVYDIITKSVDNSQNLIKKVRLTRGLLQAPLHEISLSQTLSQSIEKLSNDNPNIQIQIKQEVKNAMINGDEYAGIVIQNILDNCVKFNPSEIKQIWISILEKGSDYEIAIADNGAGISDDRKRSLFIPEKRFGGVGIYQAKFIVEKYGGQLNVQDRISEDSSQGAEFVIRIPKAETIEK